MINRLFDVAREPGAIAALFRWPKFSLASYRIVRSLAEQGILPQSVIDAGANVGQFCVASAKLLPAQQIHVFEPLPSAFEQLQRHARGFANVRLHNVALGERIGEVEFNVNRHSHSSSILPLADAHRAAFPEAMESEVIQVPLTTLDRALAGVDLPGPCLLKLDVQGYEDRVLAGASDILAQVQYIVSELSFKSMYEGEKTFTQMLDLLAGHGFRFVRPLDFLRDPRTGEILQIDALFERAGA